jgi:hypothetical protein
MVIAAYASITCASAADKDAPAERIISATVARPGTDATQFLFTRKGNLLRVENTSNKFDPINIVDLSTNKPHNTTFVRIDLNKKSAQQPGMPQLPPGFPSPPQMPMTSRNDVATGKVGPSIPPPSGFPTPPPMPSMPQMPTGAGNMPTPSQMPQMPNPAMAGPMMPPPMPGMLGPAGAGELKKTDKTKKIQGFDCTLYAISERGETFEIWVTNDSALFPFRLIERDFIGRRFRPQLLEEAWPELLRNKSLFPMEVSLKTEPGGQDRLTFKIDNVSRSSGARIDDKLFQPPEKYIEIQAPSF